MTFMLLTTASLSVCISSFALQGYYGGLYGDSLSKYRAATYQDDINSFKSQVNDYQGKADGFYGAAIAMIPVSIAMVIPSIILFAVKPKPNDSKYQKEIDDIRKKINNFNVTTSIGSEKVELGIGIKF